MPSSRGERLTKSSVRAVLRNLQRLENRLLDDGVISRRVLGKSFDRYDEEGAGRYFLEPLDRTELDEFLAAQGGMSSTARREDAGATGGVSVDRRGRQPIATIAAAMLESTCVEIDSTAFRAVLGDGEIEVPGSRLDITWARPVGSGDIEVVLGAKVPSLLEALVDGNAGQVLAGALILSAVTGHPRKDPPGRPINFVWTDHVALAAEADPATAMDYTWVRDEQALHIRDLGGRIAVKPINSPPSVASKQIAERVVLIRIPRAHREGMNDVELYEATRKWWAMAPHRHNPDYAFAILRGRVIAVFRIHSWEPHATTDRWAFRGERDQLLEDRYLGADVSAHLPHGAQNPIRYVNC